MKFVLILTVFLLCVGIGVFYSSKFQKRKKFFDALISLADKLSLEINFSRERLNVLIESFDENHKKNLLKVCERYLDFLDKKSELTKEFLFEEAKVLKNDEKDLVFMFFKALGRRDVENQTKELQGFVSRFSEVKTKCDAEQKKYGALSIKLGVVAGLFWAVIMF